MHQTSRKRWVVLAFVVCMQNQIFLQDGRTVLDSILSTPSRKLVTSQKQNLSRDMRFPSMWYVRPTKPQISLRIYIKLLTEHHLEFLSLKGGHTGSSESTLVAMPHCWKSHVTAHMLEQIEHVWIIITSFKRNSHVSANMGLSLKHFPSIIKHMVS